MGSCYELHRSVLEARDFMKSLKMKIIENQWKPLDINENNDQSMKIVPWPGDACATGGVRQHRETIRNLKKEGVGAQIGSQGGRGYTSCNWLYSCHTLIAGFLHSGSMGSGDLGCFHALDGQGCRRISRLLFLSKASRYHPHMLPTS